ncbi:MAG: hypothetical protein AAF569_04110 [Pseudomonadota bacterium]
MPAKDQYTPTTQSLQNTVPFDTVEEAWFWFIDAQAAKNDGARFVAGAGLVSRPCEPLDIMKVLDRLHRQRRLLMDHLLVLRHYGKRGLCPDPRRVKELRAHKLWKEALERIEPILVRKGIVTSKKPLMDSPNRFWAHEAVVYESEARL